MELLKDNNRYVGKVVHGLENGRTFGFPTANVTEIAPQLSISTGVYATHVRVDNSEYGAMMYVGTRPTLHLTELSLEIHLFDFQGDLYEKKIEFLLIAKVREEQRFASVDALVAQLREDERKIRALLETQEERGN